MEQNATGMQSPANQFKLPDPPKSQSNHTLIYSIVFVVISSILASGIYFFYSRFYVNRLSGSNDTEQVADNEVELEIDESWSEFVYEEASISFYHPADLTAIESESGLLISKDSQTILEIKYGQMNNQSLSDLVSSRYSQDPDIVQIRQKVGLSVIEDDINYRYFPGFLDDYLLFQINILDPETNELVETMIQTVEFLPPQIVDAN